MTSRQVPPDERSLLHQLDEEGFARLPDLLTADECKTLVDLYDDRSTSYRKTVDMQRHGFGRGQYRYFSYPLPPIVETLRSDLYRRLAAVANVWSERLTLGETWPNSLQALLNACHDSGQTRPTPLLLKYGLGDYNCLHQDLYGEIHFPLQIVVQLSQPGIDFEGGELMLVENRPRAQSRAHVIPLFRGDAAVIPVRHRPVEGKRGWRRTAMRHGVGTITRGTRYAFGLIFHDAR